MKRFAYCSSLLLLVAVLFAGCVGDTPPEVFLPGQATTTPAATVTNTPGVSPTSSPTRETESRAGTPAVTASITATPQVCTDRALMVQDVTIPDDTRVAPGQTFDKTWRLRNSGTCTWDASYALVFAKGEAMAGPSSVPFTRQVAPNETVDLTVRLTAPMTPGTYRGNWQLRNGTGTLFGLENSADSTFWVQIVSGLAPTAAPPTPAPQGLIGGKVWNDRCDAGVGSQPAPGCILDTSGSYRADGIMQADEAGIGGVAVEIGQGACPSNGLKATLTASDGSYTFLEMAAGTYCVSITPTGPRNGAILLPGNWTYPAPGHNGATVTIPANGRSLNVDFGWDYQYQPAPGDTNPDGATRIRFAPGASSETVLASLTPGVPKEYTLAVLGKQDVWITASNDLDLTALGPDGSPIPVWQTPGKWEWRLLAPSTGDIALILLGSGETAVTVTVPPLPAPDPGTIPTPERITFPGGQSSVAIEFIMREGSSRAYVVNAAERQQMLVSLSQPGFTLLVLDPNGVAVNPTWAGGNTRWQYSLPFAGDYILLLGGSGPNTLTIDIPPL